MKKSIIILFATAIASFSLFFASGAVYAACTTGSTAKDQVLNGINATGSDCTGGTLTSTVSSFVSVFSIAVGVVAVIMIIFSGFRYVTAAGDSGKITTAKNTLIYALVGLFIAAIAQVIVHTVLTTADTVVNPCPSNHSISVNSPSCK